MVLLYGIICYLIFFATFVWMILFVGDFQAYAPTTVNGGEATAWLPALIGNLALIALFGLQHTVMARKSFKQWWTTMVPRPMERSTYVLFSSLALLLLLWLWQPLTGVVWQVEATWAVLVLEWGFWLGWLVLFLSTFMINHFNLFGLRQVYFYWAGKEPGSPRFMEPGFYRYVRHPLMLGFLIAFWSTATMTAGHLLFSLGMTTYIFVGVYFEEKALERQFGAEYREYKKRVPQIFPGLKRKK